MPKNNSSARKLQRQVNASAILACSERYPCGHMHVDDVQAYKVCPIGKSITKGMTIINEKALSHG